MDTSSAWSLGSPPVDRLCVRTAKTEAKAIERKWVKSRLLKLAGPLRLFSIICSTNLFCSTIVWSYLDSVLSLSIPATCSLFPFRLFALFSFSWSILRFYSKWKPEQNIKLVLNVSVPPQGPAARYLQNIDLQMEVDHAARTVEKQERQIEALESQIGETNTGHTAASKVSGINRDCIHIMHNRYHHYGSWYYWTLQGSSHTDV